MFCGEFASVLVVEYLLNILCNSSANEMVSSDFILCFYESGYVGVVVVYCEDISKSIILYELIDYYLC